MRISKAQYNLARSPLFELQSRKRLASLLGINARHLASLTKSAEQMYREWDEEKPSGGVRRIEDPRYDLKKVQARLAKLLMRIKSPGYLMCPAPKRSYVKNAQAHVGAKEVYCLDIKSYFPSTLSRRVYWFFHKYMKCSPDVAGALTNIATYQGHLPTGSPLSPIMSFFGHIDMWEDIGSLAEHHGCTITVYIDDVTISGSNIPPVLVWHVKRRIAKNGLKYHKERHYRGGTSEVTGLIVGPHGIQLPHRRHKALRELRDKLQHEHEGSVRSKIVASLKGLAGQFKQIDNANASTPRTADLSTS